ncbi:hypothetical protein LOAG_08079 [Loa loa]|uniref:Secreted protein n=1 Tax=Loa loa TaxID=7209 RepID=A0A1I7VUW0_LOALO|nr:hypothetical protein LOAG_08079 [Loa loa]EFO20413.2 hypothetical protein LOAG_08079 [Loa loa]
MDRTTNDRCDALILLLQSGHGGLMTHFNQFTTPSTSAPIADGKNRKARRPSLQHYWIPNISSRSTFGTLRNVLENAI